MKQRSQQSAKSRLFAVTFILTFVFGIALFFTARGFVDYVRGEKSRNKLRQSFHLLNNGNFEADKESGDLVVKGADYSFELTIQADIQEIAEDLFRQYDPVLGAFILVDSSTGEILAMASHYRKRDELPSYGKYKTCLEPALRNGNHPMASIAKLITASAAIEKNIAGPGDKFNCNGSYVVKDEGAINDPKGVRHGKISMAKALAASCNPVFAQIGIKVGRDNLLDYYNRFMFNRSIDFDLPLIESGASIGKGTYRVGMAGAGYEGTWLSPVHAAAIAATFKNDGDMMKPFLIRSFSEKGKTIYTAKPVKISEPVKKKTATVVSRMMSGTVNSPGGTAYRGFYKNGKPMIRGMEFLGKTGSIDGHSPCDHYTWFIGHTEKGDRPIAFAAMVVNDNNWKIKAASYTGQFFLLASDKIE